MNCGKLKIISKMSAAYFGLHLCECAGCVAHYADKLMSLVCLA